MLEGMTRHTLGDTYADWLAITRAPIRDDGRRITITIPDGNRTSF